MELAISNNDIINDILLDLPISVLVLVSADLHENKPINNIVI